MSADNLVPITTWRLDRGDRPAARGLYHFYAAYAFSIAVTVLTTYTWINHPWPIGLAVTIYSVGVVALFGISAAYHRGPWRSARAVSYWQTADHATIALFIAATYTPVVVITLPGHWMLYGIWAAALISVLLTFIPHYKVFDVVVYLGLGWAAVPIIPAILDFAGPTVIWLLAAGGVVYTLGALFYALKWPGRKAKLFGYHEHFHLATVIAATLHLIAVWILVA
ncbi:hemolysin III family protein [Corynebacterium sp. ES2794-CONJ1]|uniref:PAQR family membrane homeostasis protein TrhA n=1 Tax=unclassified Corynebacterium TaxID=2624378 RepID=UPI0021697B03|nr:MULTISPECIES: hemolysin III family protein [unclassified Corynebacterium]MCS4490297.1 hemolysin III family protein [Corynebacterium sp. ES2775-CONJ]MCS4491892.1 hemolysin III family protein [Corynebacterium sp. ES2715-CONJ3]MCS4531997.1 hemolysin III family protein [Corynebacterium sp. ES2730-CONJ]MCU9519398.1 hemolysin III family protein [Corynebacterium sp. ES2794-CONJ1]